MKKNDINCESNPLRILRDKNYPIVRSRQKNQSNDNNDDNTNENHDNHENINPQKLFDEKDSSMCESPSYLTNTSYTFPENSKIPLLTKTCNKKSILENSLNSSTTELPIQSENNCNPIPLPPRDRNKIMQTNAKRHVRKHPLIIPAYGVQRTLNKVTEITPIDDQQKFIFPATATSAITTSTSSKCNTDQSQVDKNLNHLSPDKYSAHAVKIPEATNDDHELSESNIKAMKITHEAVNTLKNSSLLGKQNLNHQNSQQNSNINCSIDTPNHHHHQEQRTYENVDNLQIYFNNERHQQQQNQHQQNNTDSASLHFELILEDNFNKVDVVSSPDAVDGLCPFAIQKEHYNKHDEIIDFDNCTKLSGLYVNEDELRNLDIEKKKIEFIQKHPKYLEPKNELADNVLFNKIRENVNLAMQQQQQQNPNKNDSIGATAISKPTTNHVGFNDDCNLINQNDNDDRYHHKSSDSVNQIKNIQITDLDADDNNDENNDDDGGGGGGVNGFDGDNKIPGCNNELKNQNHHHHKNVELVGSSNNSVSCEDLLEFSDIKPKGYERGIDSDEVRIMLKVLGKDVSPERCLKSLEFIEWDVHRAIKIIKLQNILSTIELNLDETVEALKKYEWDLQITALKLKGIK